MIDRDRLTEIQRGLIPGERYTARVRAVSRLGVKSEWSDSVDFVTDSDASIPNPPTGLTLTFQRATLLIEWTAPGLNTDGTFLGDLDNFVITIDNGVTSVEYVTKNEFFIYTLEQNEKDFTSPGPSLTVSVKAVDTTGAESTSISDSISNATPLKPQIPIIDISETTMTITMRPNNSDSDIVAYKVERSTTPGAGFSEIAETNSDSFFSTGAPSTTYYFRYRVVDFFGQISAYSDEGSDTTAALHGRQHNSLSGLGDDDHVQYLNSTRHDAEDHTTAMSTVALTDIGNVNAISPTDGQALIYDNGTSNWIPGDVAADAGNLSYATTIGDGASTTYNVTHSLSSTDVLVAAQDLSAATPSIVDVGILVIDADTIQVVTHSAPASNSLRIVVMVSGGVGGGGGGGGASALDDLSDVDLTTAAPITGDILEYNGSQWVPATIATVDAYVEAATGEMGNGTDIIGRTTVGLLGNDLAFTVPTGGARVKLEGVVYGAGTSADILIAVSNDNWSTEIIFDPFSVPTEMVSGSKVRPSSTNWGTYPIQVTADLVAGSWKASYWQQDTSSTSFASYGNPLSIYIK